MSVTCKIIENLVDFREIYNNFSEIAIITPYDQLLWIESWHNTHTIEYNDKFICIAVYKNEQLFMLLPLEIFKVSGRTQANLLGDKHANYHFPILNQTLEPLTHIELQLLKAGIIQQLKILEIDFICLDRLLIHYRNYQNPLLELSFPYVRDSLLYTELPKDFNIFTQERRVGSNAKRDRKQIAAISKLGEWRCYAAETDEERQEILNAFYKFKPKRLAKKGIANIFGDKKIQNFIACLATKKDGTKYPLSLMALKLNGTIIAVSSSLENNSHAAGMFNAIDPEYQNIIHPGLVLLRSEIEYYCKNNINIFDLGTGEARYKRTWLRDEWEIRSIMIPITLKGKIISKIIFIKELLKKLIKHSKILWPIVQKIRVIRHRSQ